MPSVTQNRRPQRRISEQDRWLDDMGLFRKHIINDSNCLFRAISENIYYNQALFHRVRKECVDFMTANEIKFHQLVSGSYKNYVAEMSNSTTYGTQFEITVMSHLYTCNFIIYDSSKGPKTVISNGYEDVIFLYFIKEKNHYDALFAKQYIEDVSFCQSIVYGVLYERVYEMKEVDYAVKKMLHNENYHIEYFMADSNSKRRRPQISLSDNAILKTLPMVPLTNEKSPHQDSDNLSITIYPINSCEEGFVINVDTKNAKELLDNKILPFPYKVAKALDPNVYRNIELDSWYEMKRDEQPYGHYFDGLSLQVGVKCLCTLTPNSGTSYHCHIQDMKPDDGPCVVFVEELGEMRTVNFDQLKPLPANEAKPWYTPYRKERSKFSTLASILRQLGYMGTSNNIHRLKCKVKKAGGIGQELAHLKNCGLKGNGEIVNKLQQRYHSKYQAIDYTMEDTNNNIVWNQETSLHSPDPTYNDEDTFGYCHQYLEKYTKIDLSFEPSKVEMVAMPLIVERNSGGNVENSRDSAGSRPQSAPYQGQQEGVPSAHYTLLASNESDISSPPPMYTSQSQTSMSTSSAVSHSGGLMWSMGMGSGGGGYSPYNMYCPPPPLMPPLTSPTHLPLPMPRPPPPPPGVNCAVQRSLHANGSDLPYNDVLTLRFFFNLGVEWMMSSGGWPLLPSLPPMVPPPTTPSPHNYQHHRISPNQLAIELQNNMSLDENDNTPHEKNKESGKSGGGSSQKGNGKPQEYTPRGNRAGGGGGGYNHRYRRNDNSDHRNQTKNGHGYNRNQSHFNNNRSGSSKNNRPASENSPPDQENKEPHSQENSPQSQDNSFGSGVPFVTYPPPPLYRIPCFPLEGDNPMISVSYTPQYLSYGPVSEDSIGSGVMDNPYLGSVPPQYLGYLPAAPPLFYPPPPNYYAPSHFTPTTPENTPKQ